MIPKTVPLNLFMYIKSVVKAQVSHWTFHANWSEVKKNHNAIFENFRYWCVNLGHEIKQITLVELEKIVKKLIVTFEALIDCCALC